MPLSSNADLVVEQRRKSRRKPAEVYQNYFGHFLSQINIEVTRGHQRSKLANRPRLGEAVRGGAGRERGCVFFFLVSELGYGKRAAQPELLEPGAGA